MQQKGMFEYILELSCTFLKIAGRWGSHIRGEWWIDLDYGATYADQDVGEIGHETAAVDALIDKDDLINKLRNFYVTELHAGQPDSKELQQKLKKLDDYSFDDWGSSAIFFNEYIPDKVGTELLGAELWQDLKTDVRLAYAKHRGAILVINNNFYAWTINNKTITAMQDFLFSEIDNPEELNEDMIVEEGKTHKAATIPVNDFLQIKHPGELWRLGQ